jgi:hypothetical protein
VLRAVCLGMGTAIRRMLRAFARISRIWIRLWCVWKGGVGGRLCWVCVFSLRSLEFGVWSTCLLEREREREREKKRVQRTALANSSSSPPQQQPSTNSPTRYAAATAYRSPPS